MMSKNFKSRQKIALGLFVLLILGFAAFTYLALNASAAPPASSDPLPIDSGFLGGSGSVWQSLHVINADGSSYWANAPQPFSLASVFGSQSGYGDDFNQVKTLQNNIYMNLQSASGPWSFSCVESIVVTDMQGNVVAVVADAQTVNANGQAASAGQNVWVTGASVTEQQLQGILGLPPGQYFFTVTLQNISLQVTVNGQQQVFSASAGSVQNVLSWMIRIE